jgi:bile acid:Na+ symporter, BASS family
VVDVLPTVSMENNPLVDFLLPAMLFVIMLGVGLTLAVGDLRGEARAPRGLIVGSLAQLVLLPMLGFAIAAMLRLPAPLAVGLVICAACPGGTVSNLLAHLARANVALSLVLTVIASVGTIVTLPLAANLALEWKAASFGAPPSVPLGRTLGLLVGVVLVPVAVGMMIRRHAPRVAPGLERQLNRLGTAMLILLVVGLTISLSDRIPKLASKAGLPALLLNLGGVVIGFAVASIARLPLRDQIACGIEMGTKNVALGMVVAITVLGSEAALPAAMYGLFMYVTGFALVLFGVRRLPASKSVLAGACLPPDIHR